MADLLDSALALIGLAAAAAVVVAYLIVNVSRSVKTQQREQIEQLRADVRWANDQRVAAEKDCGEKIAHLQGQVDTLRSEVVAGFVSDLRPQVTDMVRAGITAAVLEAGNGGR